jgi:hypothetical protein
MISVITVGIDNWQKYTLPLIKSWQEWQKGESELVVVDNYSEVPYPMDKFYPEWGGKIHTVRVTTGVACYPAAINHGLARAKGPWYLILNNDCLITDPLSVLTEADESSLYCAELLHWKHLGLSVPYPRGWVYFLHQNVLDRVGKWDEEFKHAMADDLDYGWRCWKAGIPVRIGLLPVIHLNQEHRPGRGEAMQENRQYFWRKHGFSGNYRGGG